MNLNRRSKLSLCQFLKLFERDDLVTLLEKHGLSTDEIEHQWHSSSIVAALRDAIIPASESQLDGLVQELARTCRSMRTDVSPRYRFDERWKDFLLCLNLDGYVMEQDEYGREVDRFIPIEPIVDGTTPVEDDLTKELRRSNLANADEVLQVIDNSASAFRNGNFNSCLSNARVALETLAKLIAQARLSKQAETYNSERWGKVIEHLRISGFITKEQEKGICGVFTFISPGSHSPIKEEEYARLGRNLSLSICYFLVKQFNATDTES